MSANDQLILNLETQVSRLVQQLKDLEELKDELDADEVESMKQDTADQIIEFTATIDRISSGGLDDKLSKMKLEIREAIAKSFNTLEMIKMFGDQNASVLERQLLDLVAEFKLKKISKDEMVKRKVQLLKQLQSGGHPLSKVDQQFLDSSAREILDNLEQIVDT